MHSGCDSIAVFSPGEGEFKQNPKVLHYETADHGNESKRPSGGGSNVGQSTERSSENQQS
jgi:hypothetical protein